MIHFGVLLHGLVLAPAAATSNGIVGLSPVDLAVIVIYFVCFVLIALAATLHMMFVWGK